MAEKFPPQTDIDYAIKVTTDFMNYAEEWELKNDIIRNKKSSKEDLRDR